MKYIVKIFLLTAFTFSSLSAQDSLSANTRRVIDASLAALNMRRSDLAMPWDAVAIDPFRMSIEKKLFTEPLRSFDVITQHAGLAKNISQGNADDFFRQIMAATELGTFHTIANVRTFENKDVNKTLGANLDREVGFVGENVLLQYLVPMISAQNIVDTLRKNFFSEKILFEQIDSLLLMSEESANATLFEMKTQENRSDSIAKKFFSSAEKVNFSEYYNELLSLHTALLIATENIRSNQKLLRDSIRKTVILNTRYGRIALGSSADDVYEGDFFLIVDAGGNDTYFRKNFSKSDAAKSTVRAIIDFSGNDLYSGDDFSFAAGFLGGNYLIDLSGDDNYSTGNFTLGAGLFGVGILHDFAGTDMYSGKVFSQGSGAFGVGLLIDEAGNDLYRAYANAQGFGFTRGYGAIADISGNDTYTTTSPFVDVLRYDNHFVAFTQGATLGHRPIASGGVGFLFDFKGNDSYSTDIYGQGTAYWFGLGGLYDAEGDDKYSAYQYAQGSGVHLAQGILFDKKGEDIYTSHGVSQGCGHDIGFGALVDESGNDHYFAESLSQGAGNANAVSLFVDEKGDDSYTALNQSNTQGFSDFRRSYGMIGIFADGGGNDRYGEFSQNKKISSRSTYGVFADLDLINEKIPSEPPSAPADGGKMPLENDLDKLFIQASAAAQKFQYNVAPAQEKIVKMGKNSFSFLAGKFSTESARERLALENILPKLYDAEPSLKELLIDSLHSKNDRTLGIVATAAGKKKIRGALPAVMELTRRNNWRMRALAAQQIGEIGEKNFADSLKFLLNDTEPYVRARAAFSIGQLNAPELLAQAIRDTAQVVRNNAVQGLRRNSLKIEQVKKLFSDATDYGKISLLKLIPAVENKKAAKDFLNKLSAEIKKIAMKDEDLAKEFFAEGKKKGKKN